MYCAVIGDIKNSKNIKERQALQLRLEEILSAINKKYNHVIEAKFIITLGDEFQGLLSSVSPLMDILDEIKSAFYPHYIRFGIGLGEISTSINREMALGADGSSYHLARHNIDILKESKHTYERAERDILIKHVDEQLDHCLSSVNATLALLYMLELNWTQKQREVIFAIKKNPQMTQRALAEKIGIAQPNVHRRLSASHYYYYKSAMYEVKQSLLAIWEMGL